MAKKKTRYRGISSTKEGNLYFTIHSLGNGNFHLNIGKLGQIYLFDGLNITVGRSWNDDDVLNALFEIIDTKIFQGEFNNGFYRNIPDNLDDIPF